MQKQIILFASIFAIICASKEQSSDGGFVAAESNHIYSQPIQDNIAAESEVAKRGAAVTTTSAATNNENQGQSSQIDVGKFQRDNFKIVLLRFVCVYALERHFLIFRYKQWFGFQWRD